MKKRSTVVLYLVLFGLAIEVVAVTSIENLLGGLPAFPFAAAPLSPWLPD